MNYNHFLTAVLSFFLSANSIAALCDVCQKNGVACIDKTSFHMCFGRATPFRGQTFNCTDGFHCTDLPNICFQSGTWVPPSCENLSKCCKCNMNNVFACTGRRTFAFCFGSNTPSKTTGICPVGYVCDYTSNYICVPEYLVVPTNICDTCRKPLRTDLGEIIKEP